MLKNYKSILNELNKLNKIGMELPADSIKGTKADMKHDHIIFDHISIRDCYLISKVIGKGLSDKDFAKMLDAYYHHNSIIKALDLPLNVEFNLRMTLWLKHYQEKSGLTQLQFAKKYNIRQSKLSRMENGTQKVDMFDVYKIAQSHRKTFVKAFV